MTFHGREWASRFDQMGDASEQAFIAWATRQGLSVERLGWDRPSMGVSRMGPELRQLPDFYASDGYLYECVGLGRDGVLKGVKVEKWESLKFWNRTQSTRLWVWNSKLKQGAMIPWPALVHIVARSRRKGIESFHDGNEYYPIKWKWIKDYVVYDE